MTLIQPVQTGAALLEDINRMTVQPDEIALWWLGQSGYAIKTASELFYIDLYLSEHLTTKYANTAKPHIRMTASPIRGEELTNVRWLFASHKHSDHLDPGSVAQIFAASPQARLILPAAVVDHAVSLGIDRDRMIPTRGDESLTVGEFTVHSIPAAHPDLDYTEAGGYPFLGFVIQVDGWTLYHSGDTVVFDGLAERLRSFTLDIAFLPINGRVAPDTPPNMNAAEAVELARQIRVQLVIPHHYDMFTFNTADVRDFARLADDAAQPHRVLRCGGRFLWRKQSL